MRSPTRSTAHRPSSPRALHRRGLADRVIAVRSNRPADTRRSCSPIAYRARHRPRRGRASGPAAVVEGVHAPFKRPTAQVRRGRLQRRLDLPRRAARSTARSIRRSAVGIVDRRDRPRVVEHHGLEVTAARSRRGARLRSKRSVDESAVDPTRRLAALETARQPDRRCGGSSGRSSDMASRARVGQPSSAAGRRAVGPRPSSSATCASAQPATDDETLVDCLGLGALQPAGDRRSPTATADVAHGTP